MSSALIQLLTAALLAVPPLTPQQQTAVDATVDGASLDQAGLHQLLTNAMTWRAGDESGATVPDYVQLRASPAEHRGQLVLIEGVFAGVPAERGAKGLSVGQFGRNGPWDGKLEQWVIEVDLPSGEKDSLVVYLVDPPAQTPRAGQRVRLVARFFIIWDTERGYYDAAKEKPPEDGERPTYPFLTFIGHSARVIGGASGSAGGATAEQVVPWALTAAVLVMVVFWWRLRASLKPKPTLAQVRRRQREEARMGLSDDGDLNETLAEPLPEDPIAAMQEMERRHKAASNGDEPTAEMQELRAAVKTRLGDGRTE